MSWTTLNRPENASNGSPCRAGFYDIAYIYHSPYKNCDEPYCTKECFAEQHFEWCLEHSAPSSEEVHGAYRITEIIITRVNGQMTERQYIVEKRKCALAAEQESEDPSCNVVESG